jgi:hypothetical protein
MCLTLLAESLEKHQELFGKAPWGVAADRGFGSKDNEDLCAKKGSRGSVCPKKVNSVKNRRQRKDSLPLRDYSAGVPALKPELVF